MAERRGLSPVIATILLIGIVVVIALIVFLWIRGLTEEAITKFDGENVKLVCDKVRFDAEYSSSTETVYISNTGNVPIYQMKARLSGGGSYETVLVEDDWPETGLNPGGPYSGSLDVSGSEKIVLIPVLIGKTDSGAKRSYTCEESQGKEIAVV